MRFSLESVGSKQEKELFQKLVKSLNISEAPQQLKEIELRMYPPTEAAMAVKNIHKVWKPESLKKINTPKSLIRLDSSSLCPKGSRLAQLMYVEKYSGGMGSFFGFEGYFLSIIVSPDLLAILDARGQLAS